MKHKTIYRIIVTRFTENTEGCGEEYESFNRAEGPYADLDAVRADVARITEMETASMLGSQRVTEARRKQGLPHLYLVNRFDVSVEKTSVEWIPVEL